VVVLQGSPPQTVITPVINNCGMTTVAKTCCIIQNVSEWQSPNEKQSVYNISEDTVLRRQLLQRSVEHVQQDFWSHDFGSRGMLKMEAGSFKMK
jgi:hypothetical protein